MATKRIKAPSHLRPDTQEWFSQVTTDFVLEAHHIKLLTLACECFDRCCQAREQIDKHGLTVETTTGLKANPAVAIERDSRLAFARLLRELDLDVDLPSEARRPPALRSNRRL